MSRTLVVSDLHLGTRAGSTCCAATASRDALLAALDGVDRLVLLGDTLELRQSAVRVVLERARARAARASASAWRAAQVVLVPGNHDHVLAGGWLAPHGARSALEERFTPAQASLLGERVGALLAPASVELAYPGLWLADGVYAMHGHYLDVHMTVPTLERLAIAASGRLTLARGRRWNDVHSPADYEAVIAPLYAWVHAAAQSGRPSEAVARRPDGERLDALRSRGRGAPLRARTLASLFPLAVRGAQRRRHRPAAQRALDAGAPPRRAARDERGRRAAGHRRPPRDLRPHPPRAAR